MWVNDLVPTEMGTWTADQTGQQQQPPVPVPLSVAAAAMDPWTPSAAVNAAVPYMSYQGSQRLLVGHCLKCHVFLITLLINYKGGMLLLVVYIFWFEMKPFTPKHFSLGQAA